MPVAPTRVNNVAPRVVTLWFTRFAGHSTNEARQSIGEQSFSHYLDGVLVDARHLSADGSFAVIMQPGHRVEVEILHTRRNVEWDRDPRPLPAPALPIEINQGVVDRLVLLGYLHTRFPPAAMPGPPPPSTAPAADLAAFENDYVGWLSAMLPVIRAIYDLQVDHGLDATGNLDVATLNQLHTLVGE